MDGNKDEALRCIRIAEEAIASGNKERALRFLKIARRLNRSLQVDELLTACEELDSGLPAPHTDEKRGGNIGTGSVPGSMRSVDGLNGDRNYTEEHVQLIRQININKDYYRILGVERTCSVEEIKKAYRKLSLKVHPDKNKAPGSDEAFKKLCKAFKCLSDDGLRRQYDHTGLVDQYEYNEQHNVRHRRRRTGRDLFEEEFDPEEIFRAFFGQGNVFRSSHVYRSGGVGNQQREEFNGGGPNLLLLLPMLPFLLIFLLAYLPLSEPDYSLHRNYSYTIPMATEKHGVEFYVRSSDFDVKYPPGSQSRDGIEDTVMRDYKSMLWRYCHVESQRRQWNRNLPTPHCDKLSNLGLA